MKPPWAWTPKGLATGRAALGDTSVDQTLARVTAFTEPPQEIFLHASVDFRVPAEVGAFRADTEVSNAA